MGLKILMLEDDATDADLITRQLRRDGLDFEAECVSTKERYLKAMDEFSPDVILSDNSLPGFDSHRALEIAKEKKPGVPFIVVTGSMSEEYAVSCIKQGADDYILKNSLTRLTSAIKGSLEREKLKTENNVIRQLNNEIRRKNEELVDLSNEKNKFVSMVSHDLQNEVAPMMQALRSLENVSGGSNQNQQSPLKKLHFSTLKMGSLISEFLTVSEIEKGNTHASYGLVNISRMVEEIVEGYEYSTAKKNIKLNYTSKCRDIFIHTDRRYAEIIISNLISNAIKYSQRESEIDIKTFKNKGKYNLEIRDYGVGIPASDMPNLYGQFQKLTPKPTAGEPSNGLGLSIVKGLVDALNASIKCKSIEGKGTTFTVTF
ncbi:MAG TPA: hybrid sensor histidine kinase/response regulator [Bacteroidia bacterium]|nr:hybrid sensor histidine kinase/response regulator [Bacteroidia bacterium]